MNVNSDNEKVGISVIVPMYNVVGLIEETIENLKTNKVDCEFILVNDGSTDETYNVVSACIKNDKRFVIVNKPNGGVSSARNLGIEVSRGEYICFLDADDLLSTAALDKLHQIAVDKKADFLNFQIKRFDGEKVWTNESYVKNNVFLEGYKDIVRNKELFLALGVSGKIISRSLINGLRFPLGIKFSEDSAFMVQALIRAKNIFTTNQCTYYYRVRDLRMHEASATQKQVSEAYFYLQNLIHTMKICKEAILLQSVSDSDKKIIIKSYYDRMFTYEFKSLFLKAINAKNSDSGMAWRAAYGFLYSHSKKEINEIPAIRYFFIRIIIDHVNKIRLIDFKKYRKILILILNSLDEMFYKKYDNPDFYDGRWMQAKNIAGNNFFLGFFSFYKSYAKKNINVFLNKKQYKINKLVFEASKILLPLNEKKMVFAKSKNSPLSENMALILDAVKSKGEVLKFLGKHKSFAVNMLRAYHYATAKYIFLEDYHNPIYGYNFKKETKVVQLWHAAGAFKRFGYSAIGLKDSNAVEFEKRAHSAYTNVYVSSPALRGIYAEAFGVDLSKVKALGVPRTDLFFNEKKKNKILEKVNLILPKDKKNILYAPTFRGSPAERINFHLKIDWGMFDDEFFRGNRFVIKLHPVVKHVFNRPPESIKDHVIFIYDELTANELMLHCDLLITDYSSLIFEYALLDKPIIHYVYDLDDYYDERGFFFDWSSYVYGEIVKNEGDLIKSIKDVSYDVDFFKIERNKFKDKFMKSCDGKATKRIVEDLF